MLTMTQPTLYSPFAPEDTTSSHRRIVASLEVMEKEERRKYEMCLHD